MEDLDKSILSKTMDINCDLGEGMGIDAELMPYLTSCNIACGGHAGDRKSMLSSIHLATKYNVKIGAHPSFEDRSNFGRMEMDIESDALKSQLIHQIAELSLLAKLEGAELTHVKPHGALYNLAARDKKYAKVIIEVLKFFKEDFLLFVPFGSLIEEMAQQVGLPYSVEAFADRNYDDDFRLLPRGMEKAVLTDPEEISQRVRKMLVQGEVSSVEGLRKSVSIDTICLHGDNPRALDIAKALHHLKMELN